MENCFSQKINEAVLLQENGCLDQARNIYLELMKEFPNKLEPYYLCGCLEDELNNFEAACKLIASSLEISPFYEGFKDLGAFYLMDEKLPEAIHNLKQALIYNPDCEECKSILERISSQEIQIKNVASQKIVGSYKKSSEYKNCIYKKIYSGETIERKLPKTVQNFEDSELNKLTPFLKNYQTNICEESFVVEIPDGSAYVSQGQETYIITPDNRFLEDIVLNPLDNTEDYYIMQLDKLPDKIYAGDKILVLTSLWGNNYYHWLSLILPRIHLIEKSGYSIDEFDKILINYVGFNYQKDLFRLLGISQDKIIGSLPKGALLTAKSLVVSSIQREIPKWSTDCIRDKFLNSELKINRSKRLYISRNNAQTRRTINENEIVDFLTKYDFQMIQLENLPFEEQVAAFANAEAIIAPHGAGLVNLSFCNPKTKVLEIFNPNWLVDCFFKIGDNVKLDHYYMLGKPLLDNDLDIKIDINLLEETMKAMQLI